MNEQRKATAEEILSSCQHISRLHAVCVDCALDALAAARESHAEIRVSQKCLACRRYFNSDRDLCVNCAHYDCLRGPELEKVREAFDYSTERFSEDPGFISHGALRHKEAEACLICEARALLPAPAKDGGGK